MGPLDKILNKSRIDSKFQEDIWDGFSNLLTKKGDVSFKIVGRLLGRFQLLANEKWRCFIENC